MDEETKLLSRKPVNFTFDGLSYLCDLNIEDNKENCVSVQGEGSLENCVTDIPQLQGISK